MKTQTTKYLETALIILVVMFSMNTFAQVYCTDETPFFEVDLSNDPGGTWISPAVIRDGSCCGGGEDQVNCIELMVTLHEDAVGINFSVFSGANPGGALFYQVNCQDVPVSSGFDPIVCLDGPGPHYLSYCKVGNNQNEYAITSVPGPTVSPDIITNDGGCSQDMNISGVDPATVTWTSISPGAPNQYNNFLTDQGMTENGVSGVPFTGYTDVIATPTPGAPATIQYQVCGNADGGCLTEPFCDTITVTVIPTISVDITPEFPYLCYGQAFETLTANVTGGLEPFTYTWSNSQTTQSTNVTSGGTYSVTVNDATGCASATDEVTVIQFTEPITSDAGPDLTVCEAISSNVVINGSVTGVTTGEWTGGTGTYSMDPTDLSLEYTLSPAEIAAGGVTLTLTTTNTGDCPADTDEMTITVSEMTVTLGSQTNVSCFGGANGSAIINATGGVLPYSYSLNGAPGQASNAYSGLLAAGPYTVVVTDASGCSGSVDFEITQPDQMIFSTVEQNVSCFGVCDGEIQVSASGGTPPYDYSSNNGTTFTTLNTLGNLCAGTIGVVVQDDNGCITNANVPITQPTQLEATYTLTDPICFGSCDGEIQVNASGGTAAYSYSVDGGPMQPSAPQLTGLCSGNHTVLVEDANGCQITSVQALVDPPTYGIDLVFMSPSNCGFNNGSIEVAANGLNGPFTYSINGGPSQSSGLFTNLVAGAYSFVATDALGCQSQFFYGVNDVEMDGILIDQGDATCFGGTDGWVQVTNLAGAEPITFELDNSGITQTNGNFYNLAAGSHIVTIYDAGLCVFTIPFTVGQPDEIQFTTVTTNVTCNGGSDGTITFDSTIGGVGGYTYSIDGFNFQASPTFSGLTEGNYFLYVMDANMCLVWGEVTITEPELVTFEYNTTDLSCYENNTGVIQLVGFGGQGGYEYSIDGGMSFQSSSTFFGLAAGNYSVVVQDMVGCQANQDLVLIQPNPLTAVYSSQPTSCFGVCDGEITVTPNGGTNPYYYSVDFGVTLNVNPVLENLCAGVYPVQVIDENGCGILSNVTINTPTQVNAFVTPSPATCGLANGTLDASANGGTVGYTYSIDNVSFSSNNTFGGLEPGAYTVYVQDGQGCPANVDGIVPSEPSPVITGVGTGDALCFNSCDGSITISSTGGTGVVQYSIGGAYQLSNEFNNLCAGDYSLSITDENNCVTSFGSPVTIDQPDELQFTTTDIDLTCFENGSGAISVAAQGGTESYQYSNDNGVTYSSSPNFNLLDAGTYNISVLDANMCLATGQVTLQQPPLMEISGLVANDAVCFEYCDGSAEVSAQGGTVAGDYTYHWHTVTTDPETATIDGLCQGIYNSVVLDDNGCWDTTSFFIDHPDPMTIDSVHYTDPLCFESCDGSITIFSSTANQYSYDGGVTYVPNNVETGFCEGIYNLMVQSPEGCFASFDNLALVDPPLLTVTAGPDSSLCLGTDGTLHAQAQGGTSPYSYTWDNSYVGQSQVVTPTGDLLSIVTAMDDNGCQSVADSTLFIIYDDLMIVTSNDTSICPGMPVVLDVEIVSGQPFYGYSWTNNSTQISASPIIAISPNETNTYVIEVSDHCTTVTDSVVVTAFPTPEVTFAAIDTAGCSPFEVTIVPTIDPSFIGSNCTWTFSNGVVLEGCDTVSATFVDPGCYGATFNGISPDGCALTGYGEEVFCVYETPVANFSYDPAKPTHIDAVVDMINLSQGEDFYYWSFGSFGNSNEENPTVNFNGANPNDTILICLTTTTEEGCVDDICKPILINDAFVLYVPNTFTPDGDKHNGIFSPKFPPGFNLKNYELLIFNRWGELVFESHDPNEGWNGYYSGKLMQIGTYTWKITVTDGTQNEAHQFVGHVNLLK